MKIKQKGTVEHLESGDGLRIVVGKGLGAREVVLELSKDPGYEAVKELSKMEPVRFWKEHKGSYLFRDKLLSVENDESLSENELQLRIKHWVLQKERAFEKIERQIEAFENIAETSAAKRERIPDPVKLWPSPRILNTVLVH